LLTFLVLAYPGFPGKEVVKLVSEKHVYVFPPTLKKPLIQLMKLAMQSGNGRFPDNHFPDRRCPDKTFPGQSLSRTKRFPERRFSDNLYK